MVARFPERGPAILPPAGWDDVTNPTTYTKLGVNDKPDFDYANIGLLFPANDTAERIYITGQMRHAWEGSDGRPAWIDPHLHFIQTSATLPDFALEYRFYSNGGAVPSYATINTSAGAGAVFPYSSGSILQILEWPEILLSGLEPSAWYDMVIYRTNNALTGDVLVKGFDWHARFNDLGSRSAYRK
jgi:hypothetical protein